MEQKPKNTQVNPPAIIQKNKGSDVNRSGLTEQTSTANAAKETLLKMTQERGIANQPMFNTRPHSSQRPSKTQSEQYVNHFNRNSAQFLPDQSQMMDEASDMKNRDLPDLGSDHELQNPRYSLNTVNSNNGNLQHAFQSQDPNKPIQKMIKSGSQVLGKCRSRLNLSRKEMLKKLNDKNNKISHMVEAAHATRPTSNERSSTKKPNPTEIVSNLSLSKDLDYHRQQLFTQKYQGNNQRFNLPT